MTGRHRRPLVASRALPSDRAKGGTRARPSELPREQPRVLDGGDVRTRRAGSVSSPHHRPPKEDPDGSHDRKVSGRHHDPAVHDRHPRGGSRGPACAHRGHALAREGGRRGCLPGRAAGDDPGARALLGDRVRLAQVRGEAERLPAVHHRDRRAGHPLRPRALQARGRAAADRLPRMAGLVHRADEDRRPAHRPHGARRQRVGRLRRGDPEHAGLRVLGQADRERAGTRSASGAPGWS